MNAKNSNSVGQSCTREPCDKQKQAIATYRYLYLISAIVRATDIDDAICSIESSRSIIYVSIFYV
jgi:hypothetical protein